MARNILTDPPTIYQRLISVQGGARANRTLLAAELEYPYGRGVNLQIEVANIAALYAAVQPAAWPVFLELETRWNRRSDLLLGNRQFVVQDPDGYLLRFFEDLGSRPA